MTRLCPKTKFRTQADADDHIRRIKKTGGSGKKPRRSYLCPICNTWHLTSQKADDVSDQVAALKRELKEARKEINTLRMNIAVERKKTKFHLTAYMVDYGNDVYQFTMDKDVTSRARKQGFKIEPLYRITKKD